MPRRALQLEPLEPRRMLSGDGLIAWHHAPTPTDVNRDGVTDSSDLVAVFGALLTKPYRVAADGPAHLSLDVDADGAATPNDLRLVLVEVLEAALPSPWQNPQRAADVDDDGVVSQLDAESLRLRLEASGEPAGTIYWDVDGDRQLSPADLDLVLAELEAEGGPPTVATEDEVLELLARGAAASASDDAIIAVVDHGGKILGVHVESEVLASYAGDSDKLVFAIDGAVAKARTAAFFSSNAAPLTSRTVRFISQSTITQREVESNPNITDPDSPVRGPGFVAPIGLGGHFPPEIAFTPLVDLFAIEHQSRDSSIHPGANHIKEAGDATLSNRFNVDSQHIPAGKSLLIPESYGFQSGALPTAQSRGIATLPGGVPLYKDGELVGGIGVFFPGPDGFATFEQGFVHADMRGGVPQRESERVNAERVLEAEWIAFAAAGGSSGAGASVNGYCGLDPVTGYDLPFGRIDLVGITLEIYGPHPTRANPITGPARLLEVGAEVGRGCDAEGANVSVEPGGDTALSGAAVPDGWLVTPHDSSVDSLTAEQVEEIIEAGVAEAELTRAAIRLPLGERTAMVLAVADTSGEVLGLFRMPDATVFSIDVSVAKARNTAYYADAATLVAADRVDDDGDGAADLPLGAALTNRTFRFLSAPRYPTGAEGVPAGPFSSLTDVGINPLTAENLGPALPASVYDADSTSVLLWDAFHPATNFRDPRNPLNQNGVVFFPGSSPLYGGTTLVGGLGVSGDGVDQDDVVTVAAQAGFEAPTSLRADEFFVRGVRLPYQKFNRNPQG